MGIQAIHLDQDDDVVSIRDRMDWVKEQRVVLVLPEKGDLLTDYLDLKLVRRHADDLRLEVGLVTSDSRVTGPAKTLGFPIFRSVKESAKSRRGWWRTRLRGEYLARPVQIEPEDRSEIERRKKDRPIWLRWTLRYATILIYIFTLAFLFVTAVYAVPGAVVSLQPNLQEIASVRQIVADPELETPSATGSSVPGRLLSSVQEWQAEVDTTGLVNVPDTPARGTVVFVNQIDRPATIPAGTRVSTSTGKRITYQTLASITVPEGPGSSAEVEIVAIEPGIEGNVAANLVNRIEGLLSIQLQVRNLEPIEGGTEKQVSAVTDEDIERLRSQVVDQLNLLALSDMEAKLQLNEFLAADSLRTIRTFHETFSHFPGEKSGRLALEMRAAMEATAVDETQAVELIYNELITNIPAGFEVIPDSLNFHSGDVLGVDGEGRVTFEMIGEGVAAAKLGVDDFIGDITGQPTGEAQAFLYEQLPLRSYPDIQIWPRWFERMPYLPIRIETEVDTVNR